MAQPGLLAHLSSFFPHPEDLATESLTFLLRACPAARAGLQEYVHSLGVELPDLTFRSQVGDPETGRPDVVGTDISGGTRLIIEAKFWVGLTDKQPNAYLTRLTASEPGMLLVVAPQLRLPSLWNELLARLKAGGIAWLADGAPAPSSARFGAHASSDQYSVRLQSGHILALRSWRAVLDAIGKRLDADGESARAADLSQLRALAERMDERAFLPLRAEDLDIDVGRQVHQVALLIGQLVEGLGDDDPVEKAGSSLSAGKWYYGWSLRPRKCRKRMWVGFFPSAWAEQGCSPIWAEVLADPASGWSMQLLRHALRSLTLPDEAEICEAEGRDAFLIPLMLRRSAEVAEVLAALRTQVFDIAYALDSSVPLGAVGSVASEPNIVAQPGPGEEELGTGAAL